jgi:hypothetical protein
MSPKPMSAPSPRRSGARKAPRPDRRLRRLPTLLRPDATSQLLRVVALVAVVAVVVTVLTVRGGSGGGGVVADLSQDSATGAGDPSRSEPAEVATSVLTTWSQPELGYDQWWQQVSPLLTPGAREAYQLTDPRLVPRLAPITVDEVVAGPSDNTATVYFETASGRFGVDLSRRAEDAPWKAQRLIFPGQKSMFG